jgi:hypothetical protein
MYWAMMAFTIAHELAHVHQVAVNRSYWEREAIGSEYHADAMAYRLLLHLIKMRTAGDFVFESYTGYAPISYLDLFSMMYETQEVLQRIAQGVDSTHPGIIKRENALYHISEKDGFEDVQAKALHGWQLFLHDEYCRLLRECDRCGQLGEIRRALSV